MGIHPIRQGMPWWKYYSNRFLTTLENWVFGLRLSEYHTGYRAFRRQVLESVNLQMDSDRFIFDQEILAQIVNLKMRITEVPVPTRYFAQASSASLFQSSVSTGFRSYGCWCGTCCTAAASSTSASSTAWSGVTAAPPKIKDQAD